MEEKRNSSIVELNVICVYKIVDSNEFTVVMGQLRKFVDLMLIFIIAVACSCGSTVLILPFIGSETQLFLRIGFPFDYKQNVCALWIALAFEVTAAAVTVTAILFSVLMWYLMFCCVQRYESLGRLITNMGHSDKRNLPAFERNFLFDRDLIAVIRTHIETKESLKFERTKNLATNFHNFIFE